MGREWYHWGKAKSRGAAKSSSTAKPEPPPPPPQVLAAAAAATSGCMGAVSQLFDLNHLHLCLHHPRPPFDSPRDGHSFLKGFEAPRNSLETPTASVASISEAEAEPEPEALPEPAQGDENLHIPMGIRINTSRRDTRLLRSQSPSPRLLSQDKASFCEPDQSNTPTDSSRRDTKLLRVRAPRPETGEKQMSSNVSPAGPRTPTLVARLMGLDLLPDAQPSTTPHGPHSHSATPKEKKSSKSPRVSVHGGGASLAETPRLSLQINRESRRAKEGFVELSRHSCSEINTKRRGDMNWKGAEEESMVSRSPGYYARQIMKQVKEGVMRRRFGADITNKTGDQSQRPQMLNNVHSNGVVPAKNPMSPLSPIPEQKKKKKKKEEKAPVKVEPIVKPEERQEKAAVKQDWRAEKKGVNPSPKRTPHMNKKEEQFVRAASTRATHGSDKKCKTTPLSRELLQGNRVPSLGPFKRSDPSVATTSNRKIVQEPNTAHISKPRPTAPLAPPPAASSAAAAARSEFNYISQVLKRAGINRDTPVSTFTRWFSAARPLDPLIFHLLEAEHLPGSAGGVELSPPCNRRLMFDLVDEILAYMMRPQKVGRAGAGARGWARMHGFQVTRMVWTRVKEFPRADCKILQDIDELVEMDLSGQGSGSGMDAAFVAGEEDEDDVVALIEREIVDALVAETAWAVRGGHNGYFLRGRPAS